MLFSRPASIRYAALPSSWGHFRTRAKFSKSGRNHLQVYGSDENVVISAPTGAGKTVRSCLPSAVDVHILLLEADLRSVQVLFELAILRLLTTSSAPDAKVLYMVRSARHLLTPPMRRVHLTNN